MSLKKLSAAAIETQKRATNEYRQSLPLRVESQLRSTMCAAILHEYMQYLRFQGKAPSAVRDAVMTTAIRFAGKHKTYIEQTSFLKQITHMCDVFMLNDRSGRYRIHKMFAAEVGGRIAESKCEINDAVLKSSFLTANESMVSTASQPQMASFCDSYYDECIEKMKECNTFEFDFTNML